MHAVLLLGEKWRLLNKPFIKRAGVEGKSIGQTAIHVHCCWDSCYLCVCQDVLDRHAWKGWMKCKWLIHIQWCNILGETVYGLVVKQSKSYMHMTHLHVHTWQMDTDVLLPAKAVLPRISLNGFKLSNTNTYQPQLYHSHTGIKITLNSSLLLPWGLFQPFESTSV